LNRETLQADRGKPVEVTSLPELDETSDVRPQQPEEEEPKESDHEPVGVIVAHEQVVVEVSPEEAGVSRRQFFNRALSATFGSFLAVLGIELLAFMWPRLKGGFGASIDAGAVSDLIAATRTPDGGVVPAFIPEARAYVVPVDDSNLSEQFEGKSVAAGGLMALYQRCVHLGCRVPWCATAQGFECPCHGSKYDYIGEYFGGPAPRNLDRFVVEVIDTQFIIHTGDIVQTPRAPTRSVAYPQGPSCIGAIAVEETA
jgi:cytochrome b6-f complex iron-sulfur subunit